MIRFINGRGESIEFNNKTPIKLINFDKGSIDTVIQSSKSAYQDGGVYIDNFLDPRNLSLELMIIAQNRDERIRLERKIDRIFNPKVGEGNLTYSAVGEERAIKVVCDATPIFPIGDRTPQIQTVHIPFVAYNPFWSDAKEIKQSIASWKGNFKYPLKIPVEDGIMMGYREPSLIVNCPNGGDVPCGMKIAFRALGTLVNPTIVDVNTQETVKVNTTMGAGDVITVTTHYGNKRIELYRNGVTSNIFHLLDLESTFLQLDVGDNLFRYDAENIDNLDIDIYYTQQYLGV